MKDHLNVLNTVAGANKNINPKSFKTNSLDHPFQSIPEKDSLEPKTGDDLYDAQLKGIEGFDESVIEGMDFTMAIDYTKFIREQSHLPEGRQAMSMAHNPITAQQVAQLFGTA